MSSKTKPRRTAPRRGAASEIGRHLQRLNEHRAYRSEEDVSSRIGPQRGDAPQFADPPVGTRSGDECTTPGMVDQDPGPRRSRHVGQRSGSTSTLVLVQAMLAGKDLSEPSSRSGGIRLRRSTNRRPRLHGRRRRFCSEALFAPPIVQVWSSVRERSKTDSDRQNGAPERRDRGVCFEARPLNGRFVEDLGGRWRRWGDDGVSGGWCLLCRWQGQQVEDVRVRRVRTSSLVPWPSTRGSSRWPAARPTRATS